jgi:hypothetical protein
MISTCEFEIINNAIPNNKINVFYNENNIKPSQNLKVKIKQDNGDWSDGYLDLDKINKSKEFANIVYAPKETVYNILHLVEINSKNKIEIGYLYSEYNTPRDHLYVRKLNQFDKFYFIKK